MRNTIYKVWQVNAYIKMCLDSEDILHNIFIEGEISNFKYHSSGHMYFSIKDDKSVLTCVCFKYNASRLKFIPENGMKVVIQGNISVYERDGSYQVYVDNIMPKGIGEISLALEQLKEKLSLEGLFDEDRKCQIPTIVHSVGVVTSQTGAVIKDICHVANTRNPHVKISLFPSKVQGEEAVSEIINGIDFFNKKYPVDVLIVGRGGGSKEDLWCFNNEKLVRKIANSKIPIITAIGHETDTSLADYAADKRAATPSQAAEFAVPLLSTELRKLIYLEENLNKAFIYNLGSLRDRLMYISKILAQLHLGNRILLEQSKLENLTTKLIKGSKNIINSNFLYIDNLGMQLEAFDPMKTLRRGFVLIKQDTQYITRTKDLDENRKIMLEFQDGFKWARIIKDEVIKEL